MGMMGIFKWLRKDIIQRDQHRRTLSPKFKGLNNDAYRTALHAFLDRRQNPSDPAYIIAPNSPDKTRLDFFMNNTNENDTINNNSCKGECNIAVFKLPNAHSSEIFEIGWVAGTEERYMELIYAEWHNTKVCLRRYSHSECKSAVKVDLDVLGEIRHPNVLLLMGTTQTHEHGLIAIYEPIDCTLFNYIHEQGERVAVQGIIKCAGNLAAALKHAHMLGYIHSAISSHCVFLGSNGVVKLGGWELATHINKPNEVRNYEKLLRSEIFKWQAPELFVGDKASTGTDVYGLTLLIWEMCTMNIPWSGLNISEVKKQYVQSRRGVITNIYNFPPLLNNLLKAGLQLDVTHRTLDMIKMSRFLQRLEMQYEDEEPIYIEQLTNNNDQQKSTISSPIDISSSYKLSVLPNCRKATKHFTKKKTSSHSKTKDEKKERKKGLYEPLSDRQKNQMNIVNEVFQTKCNETIDYLNTDIQTNEGIIQELTKPESLSDSGRESNKIHELTNENIDYINDSRLSIKKLKESLASKRENFFYGDRSSCDAISGLDDLSKTSILSQVRSKDYEPHKPASHKTSLQPKQITSPTQYPTSITKLLYKKKQPSPYSIVPKPIRNAIVQPQILNPDSQSFFETSLWRKEKLICLSKMRPDSSQRSQHRTHNMETHKNTSPTSDGTFTIDGYPSVNTSQKIAGHFAPIDDSSVDITASTIPRSRSLQALKDALERATDIVRSATPITSTSSDTSPFRDAKQFNESIDNFNTNKLVFEELYKLNENADGEIRNIERSTSTNTFTVDVEHTNKSNDEEEQEEENVLQCVDNHKPQATFTNTTPTISSHVVMLRKIQCASIAEHFDEPQTDIKEQLIYPTRTQTARNISINEKIRGGSGKCVASVGFDDAEPREINHSCPRGDLIRRRSLPAELGQLKAGGYVSTRKVSGKMSELPDATVEDLYIDDEFDESSLAPNMILMNEDTATDDDNYFPDLLDSKPKLMYS